VGDNSQEHKQIADSAQIERLDSIPSRCTTPSSTTQNRRAQGEVTYERLGGSQVRDNKQTTQPDGSTLTLSRSTAELTIIFNGAHPDPAGPVLIWSHPESR
jgi:hypothetical protein